jgi:hypothetical protein
VQPGGEGPGAQHEPGMAAGELGQRPAQLVGQCLRAVVGEGLRADPGGELTAYLRRRATAEGFEQMDLVLGRARQRREVGPGRVSAQVARLPVHMLHSELCLSTAPIPDQAITEIVDELFMPLAASHPV